MRNRAVRSVLAALASGVVLAACAGENLFTEPATRAPTVVDILEPADGSSIAQGENLTVLTRITVQSGEAQIQYKVVHPPDDASAFQSEQATVTSNLTVELEATLLPAESQVEGTALVIVTATEGTSVVTADTVSITVTALNE